MYNETLTKIFSVLHKMLVFIFNVFIKFKESRNTRTIQPKLP